MHGMYYCIILVYCNMHDITIIIIILKLITIMAIIIMCSNEYYTHSRDLHGEGQKITVQSHTYK